MLCSAVLVEMQCYICRVVAFEAMFRGDVWDVVCDVW